MNDFTAFESEFAGITPIADDQIIKSAVLRHKISNELHNLKHKELEATFAFVRSFNIEHRLEELLKNNGENS